MYIDEILQGITHQNKILFGHNEPRLNRILYNAPSLFSNKGIQGHNASRYCFSANILKC